MLGGFILLRKLKPNEFFLIKFLVEKSKNPKILKQLCSELMVSEMGDGGMGSLKLLPEGMYDKNRKFGSQASDCQFKDKDGIEVIASLYLDNLGNLYELDIWKTNFERLIDIPVNRNDLHET